MAFRHAPTLHLPQALIATGHDLCVTTQSAAEAESLALRLRMPHYQEAAGRLLIHRGGDDLHQPQLRHVAASRAPCRDRALRDQGILGDGDHPGRPDRRQCRQLEPGFSQRSVGRPEIQELAGALMASFRC